MNLALYKPGYLERLWWLLLWFTGIPAFCSPTLVTLDFIPNSPTTPGGFIHFLVNGQPVVLLCDDADGPMNMSWQAMELSLDDNLSNTLLGLQDDPLTLQKYQWIALLDLQAYAIPSFASDITDAIRYITDPSRHLTGSTVTWLNWVQEQDPAQYNLSNFRIFISPLFQEQTGIIPPIPEPSPLRLTALLLVVLAGYKWRSGSYDRGSSSRLRNERV
jgi:hypothetical protein